MTDPNERYERGRGLIQQLGHAPGPSPLAGIDSIAAGVTRLSAEVGFGDILSRPGLDLRTRQAGVIVALAVLGKLTALRRHIAFGLNVGLSRDEITELLMQTVVHAGWSVATDALECAASVFDDLDDIEG